MESNRFLGIMIGRNQAAVACIDARAGAEVIDCFVVRPEAGSGEAPSLAAAVAQAVRSRNLVYDEVALALSSDFFAQYALHSMFTDVRQIEGTIKFDAEEAAAADAATLAVTFEILRMETGGSEVMVYSADRQALTDILLDLQAEGFDPVMMEPDVVSISRVLDKQAEFAHETQTLYVFLDAPNCFFLRNANKGHAVYARRVMLASKEDLTGELARQMQLTLAAWSSQEPIESIVLAGDTKQIDTHLFREKTGRSVTKTDLSLPAGESETSPVVVAAAWGAALAHVTRGRKADFRRDFMPYQGRRKILQKSLRIMSVSLTVVLLVLGIYFQFKTFRMQGYTRDLEKKLVDEYKAGMYGQKPPPSQPILTKLRNVHRQASQRKEGFGPGDENSVAARLTYILEAINKTPSSVDVNIQQITITERTMRVQGDTNGRRSTLQLFDEMKKHSKLSIESNRVSTASPRDKFEVTLQTAQEGGS